jgi:molecular chaperone DnaK
MKIRKTVGIDLGTTNSVIALLDATDGALITGTDEQGRLTFPSVVGWHPGQQRLVAGRVAVALRNADGSDGPLSLPLASVKRHMGLERRFPLGPKSVTPQEASAQVLRHVRDVLARTLNDAQYLLDSAIVTMPAYFNHDQIEATRQAGELAGFDVVELLHEPTAAAIYYSWVEGHGDATYLVYDLGGGTFDVSVIRRRLGDYEVLSVSGDPFLGGDDFDRLLASWLIENGAWRADDVPADDVAPLFDPNTPDGALRFARLVQVAEGIKCQLTDAERLSRFAPGLARDAEGRGLSLEATVERAVFNRLIKDKVDRTVDCCHEALARAKEKVGLRLGEIDYVILVGGSSRVPLVRETVRAAFCNPSLAEHVRQVEPLLHEPDLCVAYGAALRAASHGTRYLFFGAAPAGAARPDLELHLTSPVTAREVGHQVAGVVRTVDLASSRAGAVPFDPALEAASVRIRSLATGLTDEAFLDGRGTFAQEVELTPETDNALELTVCDPAGAELARAVATVRHQGAARALGRAVLPTQLITKPLQIEVLSRSRQRVKQVVAPVGATLPGTFRCTCRTQDQAGRVVVPIFEENRVVKQMVIDGLPADLPLGSPVEVELSIDVKHQIDVKVCVRAGARDGDRVETATIEPAPPASRPTREDIDAVQKKIDELLGVFSGSFRTRMKAKATQLHADLMEALRYDDEPKAIQRMAELRELLQNLEASRGQVLDPPWPRFAQLVRHCLDLAAQVADRTGRERDELFEHVHAQERYAEKAYEEHNQALYRECRENLEKYAGYLDRLLRDALPRQAAPPQRPPEEEARSELERFRTFMSTVWKQVRAKKRADLEGRLPEIAKQAGGLSARLKSDPIGVLRDVRRLGTEIAKIEEQLSGRRRAADGDDAGLLEGSS